MQLCSITFQEFGGDLREWTIENAKFGKTNLIVGRNSAGKTRLLNVIYGLSALLSGKLKSLFECGNYNVSFDLNSGRYDYNLQIRSYHVIREKLTINGNVVLDRKDDGTGTILAVEIGGDIRFQTPTSELAVVYRRDSIQHPFLEELYAWGTSARHYLFGSDFGRNIFKRAIPTERIASNAPQEIPDDNTITVLENGIKKHNDEYKNAVLKDFSILGYPCKDIGFTPITDLMVGTEPLLGIYVQEDGLLCNTSQLAMSQGMFRALALVIQLNYSIFEKKAITILIDDIGEGLDYERSTSIIKLLINKAKDNDIQLFMTSNDRFVMNEVDLEYWSILHREGNQVKIYNTENSSEKFEEFKFIGLSNFDFLSNEYFLGGGQ
jgi:energy-coupling factor transporter ATP-binding protein EcfA2